MEVIESLRSDLIAYVKKKFYTRSNITDIANEIVNQAFLDVMKSSGFSADQFNFGYMSTACSTYSLQSIPPQRP